jgi:hypothetical protein
MAMSKNDKRKEYARYAARCLEMTGTSAHRDDREVLRRMAAEWINLADAIVHQLKATK